jgi:hypothetical protein
MVTRIASAMLGLAAPHAAPARGGEVEVTEISGSDLHQSVDSIRIAVAPCMAAMTNPKEVKWTPVC